MARSVAFLRGINLGRRRVTNEALVAAVEALGFADVSAYQASGNVLFDPAEHARIGETLSNGLQQAFGFDVAVFVRTAAQVKTLAAAVPFSAEQLASTKGKIQVTMLARAPSPEVAVQAEALSSDTELVRVFEAHWFWLPESGISDSTLDFAAVERLVGVGTTRTLGTVQRIAKKLS